MNLLSWRRQSGVVEMCFLRRPQQDTVSQGDNHILLTFLSASWWEVLSICIAFPEGLHLSQMEGNTDGDKRLVQQQCTKLGKSPVASKPARGCVFENRLQGCFVFVSVHTLQSGNTGLAS